MKVFAVSLLNVLRLPEISFWRICKNKVNTAKTFDIYVILSCSTIHRNSCWILEVLIGASLWFIRIKVIGNLVGIYSFVKLLETLLKGTLVVTETVIYQIAGYEKDN